MEEDGGSFFYSGIQGMEEGQVKTAIQGIPLKHKESYFMVRVVKHWKKLPRKVLACAWRCSKPNWIMSWATCFEWVDSALSWQLVFQ